MASKEARIRLQLEASSFTAQMQKVSQQANAAGRQMKHAFGNAAVAGVTSLKAGLGQMGNQLKGLIGNAVTFGGALSLGAGIKGAVDLQHGYANIAAHLERATGQARTWNDVQNTLTSSAEKSGRTTQEMGDALTTVFAATGDAKFAEESMVAIGQAATASGKSVSEMADVAQVLRRKFGTSVEELPAMLARVLEKTDAGGIALSDFGSRFDRLAGDAKRAGVEGADGMSLLLGMLAQLDTNVGADRATVGLRQFFQQVKDGTPQMKAFQKESKLDFKADDDAFQRLRKVLKGGSKTREAFQLKFASPELRSVTDELSKPFDEAFAKAKKSGASNAAATKAGLEAFDKAMAEMKKSSASAARLKEQADKRGKEATLQLAQAFDKAKQAFLQPEMIEAIEDLAESLPELAKQLAKFASFAAKNPLMAGGAVVGAKVALDFSSGAAASLASQFMAGVKDSPGWGTAGKVAGVAAGAAAGYAIGRAVIDAAEDFWKKGRDRKFKREMETENVEAKLRAARRTGTPVSEETKKELAQTISKSEYALKQREDLDAESRAFTTAQYTGGLSLLFGDQGSKAGDYVTKRILGGTDRSVTSEAAQIDKDKLKGKIASLKRQQKDANELPDVLATGTGKGTAEEMEKVRKASGGAAKAMESAGQAMSATAKRIAAISLNGGSGGGGTNGLPGRSGNTPGSAPR